MRYKLFVPLLALLVSGSDSQKIDGRSLPFRLPITLIGDGRACSPGYIRLTKQTATWKFTWGRCEAERWESSFQQGKWVIHLHQTSAQARQCKMEIITLRYQADNGQPPFEGTGYKSTQDFPNNPMLDCSSMDK